MRYADYDQFAGIYNRHWGAFGERVVGPLNQLGLGDLRAGSRVLDLCCGTGQLAAMLVDRGFAVVGVDGSAEMISYALQNAPSAEFVVADAREFELDERVDMAVSTFDSLNHVLSLDGLRRVFERVYVVLASGGRFVFDLNMEDGFVERWHGVFMIDDPDELILAESSYDIEERVGTAKFTWFVPEGRTWRRSSLNLTQRCYDQPEVESALLEAGFGVVSAADAADVMSGWQTGRTFFSAVKM